MASVDRIIEQASRLKARDIEYLIEELEELLEEKRDEDFVSAFND